MPKKALLINPPTGKYIRDDRCQVPADAISSALRAPMDLLYYATILEERGYDCLLRDYPAEGLGPDSYAADLADWRPDLIVASITTPTLDRDLACLEQAKRALPGVLTVAKGAHLAVADLPVMRACPALDAAVRQESEKAIAELAEGRELAAIEGITWRRGSEIVQNGPRAPIADLDWLPLPDRRLLNNRLYVRPDTGEPQATILASRGCPNDCVFCLVKVVSGRAICQRSPESIVRELRSCVGDHGISNFYFRADTFTWRRPWVIELCDRIIASGLKINWVTNSRVNTLDEGMLAKMKAAGCWMLGLGIESGSAEILKRIRKGITKDQAVQAAAICRRHGIKTYGFYMIGFPWDDERTVAETVDFAKRVGTDFVEFHTAYPFPGTEFYDVAREFGLFEPERLQGSDVMTSPVRTLYLSDRKVRELRRQALRGYYLRPAYLYRTLCGIRSPKVLWNYLRKGWNLLLSL